MTKDLRFCAREPAPVRRAQPTPKATGSPPAKTAARPEGPGSPTGKGETPHRQGSALHSARSAGPAGAACRRGCGWSVRPAERWLEQARGPAAARRPCRVRCRCPSADAAGVRDVSAWGLLAVEQLGGPSGRGCPLGPSRVWLSQLSWSSVMSRRVSVVRTNAMREPARTPRGRRPTGRPGGSGGPGRSEWATAGPAPRAARAWTSDARCSGPGPGPFGQAGDRSQDRPGTRSPAPGRARPHPALRRHRSGLQGRTVKPP